jgi:hypothetical protein
MENIRDENAATVDRLRKYFGEILQEEGYIPTESFAVLGKLIRLTLDYRDRLAAETGEILTVEETRRGISAYLEAIESEKIPPGLNKKIEGLVLLWLKHINGISG